MKRILYLFCLLNIHVLFGQQITTSGISGLVKNEKSEVLEGVTIFLENKEKGVFQTLKSGKKGYFSFTNIKPGSGYSLRLVADGYSDYILNDIILPLGIDVWYDFTLSLKIFDLEAVTVISYNNEILNSSRTGAQEYIGGSRIVEMPAIDRSIEDVLQLVPQSNGLSFLGRNSKYNNYTIDGAVFNNAFGLSDRVGGLTDAQPVSLDAIEHIVVDLSNFDVRYSGFTGSNINAVLKSGSNSFKGSAYYLFLNQQGLGNYVNKTKSEIAAFSSSTYGATLGGYIIKDKLFFFFSGEHTSRMDDGLRGWQVSSNGATGDNISNAREEDLILLRNVLIDKYNYDPGEYQGYQLPTLSQKYSLKLDWIISDKLNANFKTTHLRSNKEFHPAFMSPGKSGVNFRSANYEIFYNTGSYIGELNAKFSDKISNKLVIGYNQFKNFRQSKSPRLFPIVYIDTGAWLFNFYTSFGHEQYTYQTGLDTHIFQLSDNIDISLPKHKVSLGFTFEQVDFANTFKEDFLGTYLFASLQDFIDSANGQGGKITSYNYSYALSGNNSVPVIRSRLRQIGFYVQDDFRVNDKLNVKFGLRADIPSFAGDVQYNANISNLLFVNELKVNTAILPSTRIVFSPRIGFNLDVRGDRRIQIRGGSGLFLGKSPGVWFTNILINNGLLYGAVNNFSLPADTTFSPNPFAHKPADLTAPTQYELSTVDPNFKYPKVFRFNMGLDFVLPFDILGTLDAIYTKDIDAVQFRNINIAPSGHLDSSIYGVNDKRSVYTQINNGSTAQNPNLFRSIHLENIDAGYTFFFTFKLQKKIKDMFVASVAYTNGSGETANDGGLAGSWESFANTPIALSHDSQETFVPTGLAEHSIIGFISYKWKLSERFRSKVSLFYSGRSGTRHSYVYGYDRNGDGSGNNDLLYIPASQSDVPSMSNEDWETLNNFINQDEYLRSRRGQYAEANALVTPFIHRFNLQFVQEFKLRLNHKKVDLIELRIDILNVGNLFNSSWGARKRPFNASALYPNIVPVIGQSFGGLSETVSPNLKNGTFDNDYSETNRWRLQVGLYYRF